MKNDWLEMDGIYQTLLQSVYPQPQDEGHTELALNALRWVHAQGVDLSSTIDLGAGEGFCQDLLTEFGTTVYLGIALGQDVYNGRKLGRRMWEADFNFLPEGLSDVPFTFGISRHSLEHSPFPIMTLCHWKKHLQIKHLLIVLPHPDWYKFRGRNHFSVATELQAENWFEQSGWIKQAKFLNMRQGSPDQYQYKGKTPDEMWYLLRNDEK